MTDREVTGGWEQVGFMFVNRASGRAEVPRETTERLGIRVGIESDATELDARYAEIPAADRERIERAFLVDKALENAQKPARPKLNFKSVGARIGARLRDVRTAVDAMTEDDLLLIVARLPCAVAGVDLVLTDFVATGERSGSFGVRGHTYYWILAKTQAPR